MVWADHRLLGAQGGLPANSAPPSKPAWLLAGGAEGVMGPGLPPNMQAFAFGVFYKVMVSFLCVCL